MSKHRLVFLNVTIKLLKSLSLLLSVEVLLKFSLFDKISLHLPSHFSSLCGICLLIFCINLSFIVFLLWNCVGPEDFVLGFGAVHINLWNFIELLSWGIRTWIHDKFLVESGQWLVCHQRIKWHVCWNVLIISSSDGVIHSNYRIRLVKWKWEAINRYWRTVISKSFAWRFRSPDINFTLTVSINIGRLVAKICFQWGSVLFFQWTTKNSNTASLVARLNFIGNADTPAIVLNIHKGVVSFNERLSALRNLSKRIWILIIWFLVITNPNTACILWCVWRKLSNMIWVA